MDHQMTCLMIHLPHDFPFKSLNKPNQNVYSNLDVRKDELKCISVFQHRISCRSVTEAVGDGDGAVSVCLQVFFWLQTLPTDISIRMCLLVHLGLAHSSAESFPHALNQESLKSGWYEVNANGERAGEKQAAEVVICDWKLNKELSDSACLWFINTHTHTHSLLLCPMAARLDCAVIN